ncbi:MAG TPA: hypothetical protein VFZ58_02130 [Candidatus Saccharimonadales bacterium]
MTMDAKTSTDELKAALFEGTAIIRMTGTAANPKNDRQREQLAKQFAQICSAIEMEILKHLSTQPIEFGSGDMKTIMSRGIEFGADLVLTCEVQAAYPFVASARKLALIILKQFTVAVIAAMTNDDEQHVYFCPTIEAPAT